MPVVLSRDLWVVAIPGSSFLCRLKDSATSGLRTLHFWKRNTFILLPKTQNSNYINISVKFMKTVPLAVNAKKRSVMVGYFVFNITLTEDVSDS